MKCPKCNAKLKVTDRSCIEIDYCPFCKGVWLDNGELEKITDRKASEKLINQGKPYDNMNRNFEDKFYY